jgi:hypothetical protein
MTRMRWRMGRSGLVRLNLRGGDGDERYASVLCRRVGLSALR